MVGRPGALGAPAPHLTVVMKPEADISNMGVLVGGSHWEWSQASSKSILALVPSPASTPREKDSNFPIKFFVTMVWGFPGEEVTPGAVFLFQ